MPTQLETTVSSYFSAIRAMDAESVLTHFAEGAVHHDPVGAPPYVGKENILAFFREIFHNFKQVGLIEDNIFATDNSAAVMWTGKATAHNGKSTTFDGIDVIDCNDEGKIVLLRAFWNPEKVMAELKS